MKSFCLTGMILLQGAVVLAQDVRVNGNSTQIEVFKSTNTRVANSDRIAVSGVSKPAANWGIGVSGDGAYIGVQGFGTFAGSGVRYGVQGTAGNGTSANYGIYGTASGTHEWRGFFDPFSSLEIQPTFSFCG